MKAGKQRNLYAVEDYTKRSSIHTHYITKIKLIKDTKIQYKQIVDLTQTKDIENEQSEDLRECLRVLCQMGLPMSSSIPTLYFLSTTAQFTHICPTTKNKGNNADHRPRRKRKAREDPRQHALLISYEYWPGDLEPTKGEIIVNFEYISHRFFMFTLLICWSGCHFSLNFAWSKFDSCL